MAEIYVGSAGWIMRPHFIDENGDDIDVSTATTLQVKIEKPDGADVAKDLGASAYGDGDLTDGWADYTVEVGLIVMAGDWKAQAYAVTPSRVIPTKPHTFTVKGNIYSA